MNSLLSTVVFVVTISLGNCDSSWDYLLFSQRWPITACLDWKEESMHNYCALPKDDSHWIIHGIWPTKSGTEGPNYCKSEHFDEKELLPIKDKLEEKWTNIQMPSDDSSFWKHEWVKHGSCAASLPELDTEYKYFNEGLNLEEKYDVAGMLSKNGIIAGSTPYSSEKIYNSVFQHLNKVPAIHCINERGTGRVQLSEIRICLNKTFDAIDCEGRNGPIVNCGAHPGEEVVYYLAEVPKENVYNETPSNVHWVYKLLYILRLLMWVLF